MFNRMAAVSLVGAAALLAQNAVILVVGPPGAGKTTQAERIAQLYSVPSISMPEILRKEGGGRTALNKRLREQIASGELVNDEVANALVRKRITQKNAENGFVLDGYPSTAGQAEQFERTLADLGLPKPVVIHLDVSDEVARSRMRSRGRADDSPATIERRLAAFRREERFLLDRYRGAVRRVDGSRTPNEVWASIRAALGR